MREKNRDIIEDSDLFIIGLCKPIYVESRLVTHFFDPFDPRLDESINAVVVHPMCLDKNWIDVLNHIAQKSSLLGLSKFKFEKYEALPVSIKLTDYKGKPLEAGLMDSFVGLFRGRSVNITLQFTSGRTTCIDVQGKFWKLPTPESVHLIRKTPR